MRKKRKAVVQYDRAVVKGGNFVELGRVATVLQTLGGKILCGDELLSRDNEAGLPPLALR